jgi:hypothetical protein
MARLSIAGAMLALATLAVGHTTAAVSDKHDPCSILKAEEVEAVMGPLAGPPYRAGSSVTPNPNGTTAVPRLRTVYQFG